VEKESSTRELKTLSYPVVLPPALYILPARLPAHQTQNISTGLPSRVTQKSPSSHPLSSATDYQCESTQF